MTTDLVPIGSQTLEASTDPAQHVVLACERAKAWLADALEHADIEQIVEFKSQAEAIRVYTAQRQLGKDAELSAAEIVRRAERGLGLAIRNAQEAGEIETPEEAASRAGRARHQRLGNNEPLKPRPLDYATADELSGNGAGIYQMTDGVTDEQFEAAIEEGKVERNLSRANVVRKARAKRDAQAAKVAASTDEADDWVPAPTDRSPRAVARRRELIRELAGKALTSQQISERIGIRAQAVRDIARQEGMAIPADEALGRGTRKKIDSNRIVRETVNGVEGLEIALDLVRFDELDRAEIPSWITSLKASIRVLNRLNKQLKEMIQ